jgi:hypothetical protein
MRKSARVLAHILAFLISPLRVPLVGLLMVAAIFAAVQGRTEVAFILLLSARIELLEWKLYNVPIKVKPDA